MAIEPKFTTSKEAKAAGWFSKRHKTSKEHLEVKKQKEENLAKSIKEIEEINIRPVPKPKK